MGCPVHHPSPMSRRSVGQRRAEPSPKTSRSEGEMLHEHSSGEERSQRYSRPEVGRPDGRVVAGVRVQRSPSPARPRRSPGRQGVHAMVASPEVRALAQGASMEPSPNRANSGHGRQSGETGLAPEGLDSQTSANRAAARRRRSSAEAAYPQPPGAIGHETGGWTPCKPTHSHWENTLRCRRSSRPNRRMRRKALSAVHSNRRQDLATPLVPRGRDAMSADTRHGQGPRSRSGTDDKRRLTRRPDHEPRQGGLPWAPAECQCCRQRWRCRQHWHTVEPAQGSSLAKWTRQPSGRWASRVSRNQI